MKKMVLIVCQLLRSLSLPGFPAKLRGPRGEKVETLHGRDHRATVLAERKVQLCVQ